MSNALTFWELAPLQNLRPIKPFDWFMQQAGGDRGGPHRLCPLPVRRGGLLARAPRLRAYRKEWDEGRGVWKDRPRHDEASHGADAFLTFACSSYTPPSVRARFNRKLVYPVSCWSV